MGGLPYSALTNQPIFTMAEMKKSGYQSEVQAHRIRITLTSQSTANIEKVCKELIRRAKAKTLRHHTRKTPNGEGSKTWDFYEMRIHKRLIDLHSSSEVLKQIININIEPGVEVDVTIHSG